MVTWSLQLGSEVEYSCNFLLYKSFEVFSCFTKISTDTPIPRYGVSIIEYEESSIVATLVNTHKTHTLSPYTAFPTIQSHQPSKQNGRDTTTPSSATAHPHATTFQDDRRSNHNPARRHTTTIPVPQSYVRRSRTRVFIPSDVGMRSRDGQSRHRVREKSTTSRVWRGSN